MKKKAFGIVLLILAALVLLQGNFGIPSFGGQIWPLLGIAFFAYQSVESLLRRHLTSAVFTALVALMIEIIFITFCLSQISLYFGLVS